MRKRFVVAVDGWPVEVDILTVLKVYMQSVVFMSVLDTEFSEVYQTIGGCLGINANMTLTKLSFSLTMLDVIQQVDNLYNVKMWVRLAGDDFTFMASGQCDRVNIALKLLEHRTRRDVGELKEFRVVNLSDNPEEEWISVGTFCKKTVCVRRQVRNLRSVYQVKTLGKLPIMTQLLSFEHNVSKVENMHSEMLFGLQDRLRWLGPNWGILQLYDNWFRKIHNHTKPWTITRYCSAGTSLLPYIRVNNEFFSPAAYSCCAAVLDLTCDSGNWRTNISQKAKLLTRRKKVFSAKIEVTRHGWKFLQLYLSRREKRPGGKWVQQISLARNKDLIGIGDECFCLILEARQLIKENF